MKKINGVNINTIGSNGIHITDYELFCDICGKRADSVIALHRSGEEVEKAGFCCVDCMFLHADIFLDDNEYVNSCLITNPKGVNE
jgi:hypothetical protein